MFKSKVVFHSVQVYIELEKYRYENYIGDSRRKYVEFSGLFPTYWITIEHTWKVIL